MHELRIVESLLDVVLKHAQKAETTHVLGIYLVVGDLAGVDEDLMNMHFRLLSENTIAAGARVVFARKPARLRCRTCNFIFTPERLDFHCPSCKTQEVDIIGGRELYVDQLEVE